MKNFIALLLFFGGFGLWKFYRDQSQLKESLASAQEQVDALEKSTQPTRLEVTALKRAEQLCAEIKTATDQLTELQRREQQTQQAIEGTQREAIEVLRASRQKYAGQALPDLQLKDGRKLGRVRLIKLEESSVSVATSGGVVKFEPGLLPDALRKHLLYAP